MNCDFRVKAFYSESQINFLRNLKVFQMLFIIDIFWVLKVWILMRINSLERRFIMVMQKSGVNKKVF